MIIQRYLDQLGSNFKLLPRYMAHVRALLEKVEGAYNASLGIPAAYDINTAVGAQLDAIGTMIGVSRDMPYIATGLSPVLYMDDDLYRKILKSTILQNSWDGTLASYKSMWASIFEGEGTIQAVYTDNMDMSATVTVSGDVSPTMQDLIQAGYVFPAPTGVSMTYVVSSQTDRTASADLNMMAAAAVSYGQVIVTAQ